MGQTGGVAGKFMWTNQILRPEKYLIDSLL